MMASNLLPLLYIPVVRRCDLGTRVCMCARENFSHLIFNSVHGYNRNS